MDHKNPISPEEKFVTGLPKENPFSVPEGYFEELPDSILFRIKGRENHKADFSSANHFEVPEGYFDSLSKSILVKTAIKQKTQGKIIWLHRLSRVAVAAVAVVAVSLVIWISKHKSGHSTNTAGLEQVSDEEIFTYLENNNVSIDLVAEVYAETVSDKNKSEASDNDSNALMEQYILDNADEQLILEEL